MSENNMQSIWGDKDPMDGLMERFNRTLLKMLSISAKYISTLGLTLTLCQLHWTSIQEYRGWEANLPLVWCLVFHQEPNSSNQYVFLLWQHLGNATIVYVLNSLYLNIPKMHCLTVRLQVLLAVPVTMFGLDHCHAAVVEDIFVRPWKGPCEIVRVIRCTVSNPAGKQRWCHFVFHYNKLQSNKDNLKDMASSYLLQLL